MKPVLLAALCTLAACSGEPVPFENLRDKLEHKPPAFPAADRPVAHIVSPRWSTEESRDRVNEANEVMARAGIKPA